MTNELFANNMEVLNVRGGANQLQVTPQLNAVAGKLAAQALAIVLAEGSEYIDRVRASQTNHDEMDRLIEEVVVVDESINVDFLADADEEELEKVLKSQQSKRSRSKNQTMTVENYTKMMTAAVAEMLVRQALGKPKGHGGAGTRAGEATYTEEELQKLALDPAALAKAIRNVQSKKSIAKSKADFDENGERWQSLLVAEQQLKDLRASLNGTQSTKAKEAIETVEAASSLVADVDVKSLKADEAKEMLAQLQQALAGQQ